MSLSWHEVLSIVLGLGGGYWLVGRILDRNDAPEWKPSDFEAKRSPDGARGEYEDNGRSSKHEDYAGWEGSSRRADEGPSGRGKSSEPPGGSRPWWDVLGVPRIATRDEVSRAYKRRISEYHPDKVAQMGEEIRALAERKSKEINAAYDEALRSF